MPTAISLPFFQVLPACHPASVEEFEYRFHKSGNLALVWLVVVVDTCQALCHDESFSGSRDGNVELSRIFGHQVGHFLAVEVWISTIDGIEDDDVVELESLGFVYGGDDDRGSILPASPRRGGGIVSVD